MRYIHKKHGTVRNVRLQSLITSGLRAVDESVNTIAHVKENFSQWKYETQNVLRALDEKTSKLPISSSGYWEQIWLRTASNETQKKEAERKIVGTQRYEETLQKHRQKLEESREVFNEALQDYKDTYNDFRSELFISLACSRLTLMPK